MRKVFGGMGVSGPGPGPGAGLEEVCYETNERLGADVDGFQ